METILDTDVTGSDIGNHLRDEKRTESRSPVSLGIIAHFVEKAYQTSDTRSPDNTDTVFIQFRIFQNTRIGYRLIRSDHPVLGIKVVLAHLLAIHVLGNVKSFQLASELSLELRCIETGNRSGTAGTGQKGIPIILKIVSDRRQSPHPGNNDSLLFHKSQQIIK